MKLIAKIDFNANGVFYAKGDEIIVDNKNQAIKLNELGYIEPLTAKQIQEFDKKEKVKDEKEEAKWQI